MLNPALLGGFRSGTTLLINLLASSNKVLPWFESKELCEALRWLKVLEGKSSAAFESELIMPTHIRGFDINSVYQRMAFHVDWTDKRQKGHLPNQKKIYEKYPVGYDHVLYSRQEAQAKLEDWRDTLFKSPDLKQALFPATKKLINELLERQAKGNDSWTICVNKTPEITRFSDILAESGPVKAVLLIRDARFVVQSALDLGWGELQNILFKWRVLIEQSREAAQHPDVEYLEIRYEDLITHPESSLEALFTFLGVDDNAKKILDMYPMKLDVERLKAKTLDPEVSRQVERQEYDFLQELGYL